MLFGEKRGKSDGTRGRVEGTCMRQQGTWGFRGANGLHESGAGQTGCASVGRIRLSAQEKTKIIALYCVLARLGCLRRVSTGSSVVSLLLRCGAVWSAGVGRKGNGSAQYYVWMEIHHPCRLFAALPRQRQTHGGECLVGLPAWRTAVTRHWPTPRRAGSPSNDRHVGSLTTTQSSH